MATHQQHWSGLPSYDYFEGVLPLHQLSYAGVHEAAHAVVGRHCNVEMGDIRVWLVPEVEDAAGYVALEGDDRHPDKIKKLPDLKLRGWLIGCAAGQVGEAMWWERYKGESFEGGLAKANDGACIDQANYAKLVKVRDYELLPLAEARFQARAILTPRWKLVEMYAARLVRKGRMHARDIKAN